MTTREPFGQFVRLAAIVCLLVALFGLLVWSGGTPGDPLESEAPNEVAVTGDREAYVGEQVRLGGRVVDTDPVVVATWASGDGRFTVVDADEAVKNADRPIEPDDRITAYGTLEDESTLATERVTIQNPNETGYMLVVSLLGGLWVAGRFVRGWRFDLDRLAFVPREQTTVAADDDASESRPSGERTSDAERPQSADAASDGGETRG